MPQNKDIESYCCPVGKQEDQNLMDTANWIGRGTDDIAKSRAAFNPNLKHDVDGDGY